MMETTYLKQIKSKRYTGLQPQYFPRLHYFARIFNADIFVVRDDVQFVRKHKYPDGKTGKSYQANTPIKQSFGSCLLSIPVKHNGFSAITKTQISYEQNWVESHLVTLQFVYKNSPHYAEIYPEIEKILNTHYPNIAELNTATIYWGILKLLKEQDITNEKLSLEFVENKLKQNKVFRLKEIKITSEIESFNKENNLSANEKIIKLCKKFGVTEDYCGGTAMAAYVDEKLFKENGIKIIVQDWKCKEYNQLYNNKTDFIPNLSIIDLLMNVSIDEAISVIKG